jgi:RNA polymerase sigma-54 factor
MKKLRTEIRLALKQKLTPQLYQLLKLLQMPYIELEQTVREELVKNPLLDEDEDSSTDEEESHAEESAEEIEEIDWTEYFQGDSFYSYRPMQYGQRDMPERVPVSKPSMREQLIEQVHLNTSSEQQRIIGEYIVDSLDDDGFLDMETDEMANVLKVREEDILEMLKIVQTFDPPGVGSRNVEECLTIQLFQKGFEEDSVEVRIVKDFLKDVAANHLDKIRRKLHVSKMKIKESVEIISSLHPKPFSGFGSGDTRYVIPDVIVKKVDDGYEVMLNETSLPALRINSYYKEILNEKESLLKEEKEFIKEKLNSALNLMRGLEERRHSILKVTRYLVEKQKGFFEEGVSKLVPLTMQVVADAVGLHESTVSRIVQGKYMDTPRGLLELKFFFSGGITKDNDVDISTRSVKEKIRAIVEKENKERPLRDKQIVNILKDEGINIARRTVAKYRAQLKILPARLRRES